MAIKPLLLLLAWPIQTSQAAAKPLAFVGPRGLPLKRGRRLPVAPYATVPSAAAAASKPRSIADRYLAISRLSSSIHNGSDDVQEITDSIIDDYELSGRFERWSFLQKLLENELPHQDVENVILAVFSGYLKYGPRVGAKANEIGSDDDNDGNPSPVIDEVTQELIQDLVDDILSIDVGNIDGPGSRFLHHIVQPPIDYELEVLMSFGNSSNELTATKSTDAMYQNAQMLLGKLEKLLPDPAEDEDAHKSAWDLVIELYGRESVRVKEEALQRNGVDGDECKENLSWKTFCCIGRVLIHYDFLTKGILSG